MSQSFEHLFEKWTDPKNLALGSVNITIIILLYIIIIITLHSLSELRKPETHPDESTVHTTNGKALEIWSLNRGPFCCGARALIIQTLWKEFYKISKHNHAFEHLGAEREIPILHRKRKLENNLKYYYYTTVIAQVLLKSAHPLLNLFLVITPLSDCRQVPLSPRLNMKPHQKWEACVRPQQWSKL